MKHFLLCFLIIFILVSLTTSAAEHYVDNAANGNNDGTSWTDAWECLGDIEWNQISPGDNIYISGGPSGGTKTYTGQLIVLASGIESNPITIKIGQTSGHDGKAIIENSSDAYGILVENEEYVIISGQVGSGSDENIIVRGHSNDEIRLHTITGVILEYLEVGPNTNDDAILVEEYITSGNIIRHCDIHDFYGYGILIGRPDGDADAGITNDEHLIIENNEIYNLGDDAIHAAAYAGGLTIKKNHIHTQLGGSGYSPAYVDGFHLRGFNHVTVESNEIHDLWSSDGVNGYIYLECDSQQSNENCHDIYVYNNVIYETDHVSSPGDNSRGIQFAPKYCGSLSNVEISGNTIVDTRVWGLMCSDWSQIPSSEMSNIKILNNIIYNNDQRSGGSNDRISFVLHDLHETVTTGSVGESPTPNIIWDYNLVDALNGQTTCRYGASDPGTLMDYSEFNSASGCDDHGVEADPVFDSYSENSVDDASDLKLSSGDTTALDRGTPSSAFSVDFADVSRPQGSGWDIGAFEMGGSTCSGQCTKNITQYGITWTFDKEYEYGQYVNGDYWVKGPVTIMDIDPGSIEQDGRYIHGSMLDPEASTSGQGFDSDAWSYDHSLNVAWGISEQNPLVVHPNTSLISSISLIPSENKKFLDYQAILTVVDEVPKEESFRPPFVETDKRMPYTFEDINTSILKNITAIGNVLSWDHIESKILPPFIGYTSSYWVGHNVAKFDSGIADYGREIAGDIGAAALMINIDASLEEKKMTIAGLIQRGIDTYAMYRASRIENDRNFLWWNDGGIKQGRKLPVLIAGVLLDDPDMKNIGYISEKFHEDGQTFYVSENEINQTRRGNVTESELPEGVFDELVEFGYLTEDGIITDKTMSILSYDDDPFSEATTLEQTTRQDAWSIIKTKQDWWPDYRTGNYISYTENEIGMPEWGIRHSTNPFTDNAYWGASYRKCCNAITYEGMALSVLIMGIKELYNHDAFFDYVYRYKEIESLRADPFGYEHPAGAPTEISWNRGGWHTEGRWTMEMYEEYWDDYYSMEDWYEKYPDKGFHDADTNQNSNIEFSELLTYVGEWRTSSSITLSELIEAIRLWKN